MFDVTHWEVWSGPRRAILASRAIAVQVFRLLSEDTPEVFMEERAGPFVPFPMRRTTRLRRRVNYADYIQSKEWKRRAADAKSRAGHRCQLCYSPDQIDAHHRTYVRLGEELPEDITVLCRGCHAKFHDKVEVPHGN